MPRMDVARSVDEIAADTGFSGAIRIDAGGETWSNAYGFAHRGLRVRNQVETQFATASAGKGHTALAVVSLIAEGSLKLDTTARSLLGDDLPLIADDVTVEHLLSHASGIGDYIDEDNEDLSASDYVLRSPVHQLTTTEAFLVELDGYPTKFEAGERFSYCNAGFVVLALIAERASGAAYHDLVMQRVVGPAGLVDTGFLRSDEPSGRMALGYLEDEGNWTNVLHLPVLGNGDGGICSTVGDMHRFWEALFEGRIVPSEWVTEMTRPRRDAPDEDARYGLGFWLAAEGPSVRLVGADAGVSFTSAHDPTTATTWTVVSNTSSGAWPLVQHLLSTVDQPG